MIGRVLPLVLAVVTAGALLPAEARSQVVHAKGIDSLHVKANVQVQFNTTSVDDEPSSEWPSDFPGGTWNLSTAVHNGDKLVAPGLPAGALRGGHYDSQQYAAVFALNLSGAPSDMGTHAGVRCVAP